MSDHYDPTINGKKYSIGQGSDGLYYFTCHDTDEESEPYDTPLEAYQAALIWEAERDDREHEEAVSQPGYYRDQYEDHKLDCWKHEGE